MTLDRFCRVLIVSDVFEGASGAQRRGCGKEGAMMGEPLKAAVVDDGVLAEIEKVITRQSLHREILYKTLAFCQERRSAREVEEEIAAYPEFKSATQNQYFLMNSLVEAGGLSRSFVDCDGVGLDWEALEDASDDEIDALVSDEVYETTEAGRRIVALHEPSARLRELMDEELERSAVYREILAFCAGSARSYREISDLLAGRDVLMRVRDGVPERIQPSVLIDRLNVCGGIIWDGGWSTTREGKEFMAS